MNDDEPAQSRAYVDEVERLLAKSLGRKRWDKVRFRLHDYLQENPDEWLCVGEPVGDARRLLSLVERVKP